MSVPLRLPLVLLVVSVSVVAAGPFGLEGEEEGGGALSATPLAASDPLAYLSAELNRRQGCNQCHPVGDELRPVLDELFSMSSARQPLRFESEARRDLFGKALAKLHDRSDTSRFLAQDPVAFEGRTLTPKQAVEEYAARLSGDGALGTRVLEDLQAFHDLPTTHAAYARQLTKLVEGGYPLDAAAEAAEIRGFGLETVHGDLEYDEIPLQEARDELAAMRRQLARLDEARSRLLPGDLSPALLAQRGDVLTRLDALAALVVEVDEDPNRGW